MDHILAVPLWLNHNYLNPYHIVNNLAKKGILTIKDIWDEYGLMTFEQIKAKFKIRVTILYYNYIIHILPVYWKIIIRLTHIIPS